VRSVVGGVVVFLLVSELLMCIVVVHDRGVIVEMRKGNKGGKNWRGPGGS
jgi:hypothetical protein